MSNVIEVESSSSLAALIDRTVLSLRTLAEQLEQGSLLEPIEWIIPMSDIGSDRMEVHCAAIAERLGKKYLAVYSISFDQEVPLDRVYDVVDGNRAKNKTLPLDQRRAFARVNNRRGCLGSRCLYVGKSEKTGERLRQHLVEPDSLSTFAVHMSQWPMDISGNLIIRVVGIERVPSALVPFIEDQMATETPPILGKRGSV